MLRPYRERLKHLKRYREAFNAAVEYEYPLSELTADDLKHFQGMLGLRDEDIQPNHHISKTVRIGEVREDGLFDIIWATEGPIEPVPWNQYVKETKGFACDWTDPIKGGKYKEA